MCYTLAEKAGWQKPIASGLTMLDIDTERKHLAQADIDIAEGERRVREQAQRVDHMQSTAMPGIAEALELLDVLKATLQTWRDHRALIVQAIADLEQGTLSGQPP